MNGPAETLRTDRAGLEESRARLGKKRKKTTPKEAGKINGQNPELYRVVREQVPGVSCPSCFCRDVTTRHSCHRELQQFPLLMKQSGGTVPASLRTEFTRHMNILREEIKSRFADVDEYLSKESWVMDPYICSLEDVEYLGCEDEFADLQADSVSKKYFHENGYKKFWIVKGHAVAPRLAKHAATRVILPFSTTYLSETAFSALLTIKTKARNRLDVHQDFRLAVTSITPDIPSLVRGMQAQGGH
ncbi:protein FAM200C-like [Acipenser ruthenus]|uniref:protein FAM200C-like n=1 Tax=Acipenser ruthenus TaxID=7906 RepID=UPI002741B93E|nr:protein FAM200C-like [Acipenser ruthenus]